MNDTISMTDIERAALVYGATHRELAAHVADMDALIQATIKEGLPSLRRLVAKATKEQKIVEGLVDVGRALFEKKRTHEFHGIKVGLVKGRGGLRIDDADRTVELIEKHFPTLAPALIRTKKEPDKTALNEQEASVLKKIGCEICATEDVVVVKPTDGKTEKLAKSLLAGGKD